jgi:hypothetical protein
MWQVAIPIAFSLAGSALQSQAAAEGAEMSAQATQAATDAQIRAFQEAQALQAPYREAGLEALQAYEAEPVYGFTPEEEMRLQKQQAGLRRVYSAQGKRFSGEAARGQAGLAEQATADAYNRAYGRMLEGAGIGSQASGLGAQQAMGAGQGIASSYLQGAAQQIPYVQQQGQLAASNLAALSQLGGNLANYYSSLPSQGAQTTIGGPGLDAYNMSWVGTGEGL